MVLAAAALWLGMPGLRAAPVGSGARSAPHAARRHAVVVGISAYDAGTRIPQLPQVEASAREVADRLRGVADFGPSRVRLLSRRVPRADLLAAIRSAGRAAGRGETLLVAVLCAADRLGLMASDGRLKTRDLREALYAVEGRPVVLLLDAAGSSDLNLLEDDRAAAVLASSGAGQGAWPLFRPEAHGRVEFVSAAAAGWCRALQRDEAGAPGDLFGDLGARRGVSAEDLAIASDMAVAGAMPSGNGERPLDPDLAFPVIQAVDPPLARRLRAGPVPFARVRDPWSKADYERWAAVLFTLGEYRLRQADEDARRDMLAAVGGRHGRDALLRLHRNLLGRGLLVSVPPGREKAWKSLVLHDVGPRGAASPAARPSGSSGRAYVPPEVGILEPLRQEGRLWGQKDLAVVGPSRTSAYAPTYGDFRGSLDEEPLVTVRLRIFGTEASGWWEGELHGEWLRGPWQGRYDPRSGRLEGRIAASLGARRLLAAFEGSVSHHGLRAAGWWRSPDPRHPDGGHWRVDK